MVQYTLEWKQLNAGYGIGMHVHWFSIQIDVNMYLVVNIHAEWAIKQIFVLLEDG